jgi:Ser/Thr protein kinase RdoA (MazF antagonist)
MTAAAADAPLIVARAFALPAPAVFAAPLGRGHIHDSYVVTCDAPDGGGRRFVLQRINDRVFADPAALMENVARVTDHVRRRLAAAGTPDPGRRTLTLVPARDGGTTVRDASGGWWRAYAYIEDSVPWQPPADAAHAREAARAFGEFQRLVDDLPGPRLHETIPGFHATPRRVDELEEAVRRDPHGRAAAVREELARVLRRRALALTLLAAHRAGALPERVTHNDTKLDNVLFDARSGAALCVVDLDTVMPGLAAYDFGDLVRSCAASREDAPDTGNVGIDLALFDALLRGYLEGTGGLLTAAERAVLPVACQVIAYELGVRFLTDHVLGDVYFRTARPGQNLDRARAQLALVDAFARAQRAMEALVARVSA